MYTKISFAVLVFGLMTALLTACSIKDEPAGTSGPQVHMTGFNFMQDSITINKGETLTPGLAQSRSQKQKTARRV